MVASDSLTGVPFFEELPAEDRTRVAELGTRRNYAAGDVIFTEGAPSRKLCILESGLVSFRQHPAGGGDDVTMGSVNAPGDVFGISALVGEGGTCAHTAMCVEDSAVIELDGPSLLAFCEESPAVGVRVLRGLTRVMAERLGGAREQIRSRIRPGLISHG